MSKQTILDDIFEQSNLQKILNYKCLKMFNSFAPDLDQHKDDKVQQLRHVQRYAASVVAANIYIRHSVPTEVCEVQSMG